MRVDGEKWKIWEMLKRYIFWHLRVGWMKGERTGEENTRMFGLSLRVAHGTSHCDRSMGGNTRLAWVVQSLQCLLDIQGDVLWRPLWIHTGMLLTLNKYLLSEWLCWLSSGESFGLKTAIWETRNPIKKCFKDSLHECTHSYQKILITPSSIAFHFPHFWDKRTLVWHRINKREGGQICSQHLTQKQWEEKIID